MRAKRIVQVQVIALAEEVQIEIGQHRPESVGVLDFGLVLAVACAQTVRPLSVGDRPRKQSNIMNARQLCLMAAIVNHLHTRGIRQQRSHNRMPILDMTSEITEWITMPSRNHSQSIGR
jgi:hypothetical protein